MRQSANKLAIYVEIYARRKYGTDYRFIRMCVICIYNLLIYMYITGLLAMNFSTLNEKDDKNDFVNTSSST